MRHLRVLYGGSFFAGRAASMAHLARLSGASRPEDNDSGAVRHRLEGIEVLLSSGERVTLDAMAPDTGNLYFESLAAAARTPVDWIREHARAVLALLPKLDGVIFVVDSRALREDVNLPRLRSLLDDLRDGGLDVDRLPFVFQCNMRDCADAVPFTQLAASLATARCAHVESVAYVGHGVVRALDTLVALIDGGTPEAASTTPAGATTGEPAQSSPARLFEPRTTSITRDGELHDELRTSIDDAVLVLEEGAIARAWPKSRVECPPFSPGTYAVEIATRSISIRERELWRLLRRRNIAARVRRRDAAAVRQERFSPAGRSSTPVVLVGDTRAFGAVLGLQISNDARARARTHGAAVLARGVVFYKPASEGELAMFWLDRCCFEGIDIWLGYDSAGRVVEVSLLGDDGRAVLRRITQEGSAGRHGS